MNPEQEKRRVRELLWFSTVGFALGAALGCMGVRLPEPGPLTEDEIYQALDGATMLALPRVGVEEER